MDPVEAQGLENIPIPVVGQALRKVSRDLRHLACRECARMSQSKLYWGYIGLYWGYRGYIGTMENEMEAA